MLGIALASVIEYMSLVVHNGSTQKRPRLGEKPTALRVLREHDVFNGRAMRGYALASDIRYTYYKHHGLRTSTAVNIALYLLHAPDEYRKRAD